ncbi:MAG: GspE/PulE family protein [Defluviitaleaceae bacterium]|nr:GspE/PulE family protein [Defluviitaleaceae bacterium]
MHPLTLSSIDPYAAKLLGHAYATKYQALPVKLDGEHLHVAMAAPNCAATLANLADVTGLFIVPHAANPDDIRLFTNQLLAPDAISTIASQLLVDTQLNQRTDIQDPALLAEISSAPAVRLIDSIIESAILHRASDIHIEPCGAGLRTRCRIDGILRTYHQVDISLLPNVISRLKIMGGLDIAENRRPQDGRFTMGLGGETVDFRLSTLPTTLGEKAVLRLLYDQATRLSKAELGFFEDDLARLTDLFHRPYGAIFMTGPTGSGKSTTLSSFMAELNREGVNIITVEDPVENPIIGVNHVNVERTAGFTFAGALRHILRQDPDIIMIGEIRDEETARIAVQAATTGHVVLSTLHTNDAAGVIERLMDMGIEPYLSASALAGVISQRLVRRICPRCAGPGALSAKEAQFLGLSQDTQVFEGKGCESCAGTGYKGRLAVYEYIVTDEDMHREMSARPYEFAAALRKRDAFRENALRHLLAGHTTAEEIVKILNRV